MKDAFKKFIISLIGRKMIFAFLSQVEKWTLIALYEKGMTIGWELVAVIAVKDIVILAYVGLVQFEKVTLKAGLGNA